MPPRTVDDYLKLPYAIEVVYDQSDDHPGWFARVVELPGCMTQADTFAELESMIEDAMRGWIEAGLEDGQPIPEPRPAESYSGKFVVRLPRSLHRQLAEAAERDGVSLNAYVSVALGRAVGLTPAPAPEDAASHSAAPAWSRLSPTAHRALAAAGLETEAQQINEQLLRSWLSDGLQQIEADIESGGAQGALERVAQLRQKLRQPAPETPKPHAEAEPMRG